MNIFILSELYYFYISRIFVIVIFLCCNCIIGILYLDKL